MLTAYIAAPLFCDAEKSFNLTIDAAMRTANINTYLPQRDGGEGAAMVATGMDPVRVRGAHTMYSYSLASVLCHHEMDIDEAIRWLRAFSALTGPTADLALWLRPPVPVAISRWSSRDALTPTGEQRAFLAHVDTAYDQLARRDPP